jgi:NAD(P)H-hydrate epimerase
MSADARANYEILRKSGFQIPIVEKVDSAVIEEIRNADTIVDAMLGTGARTGLVSPTLDLVQAANCVNALRIAIDIPTGLDCDTGEIVETCFGADHTLTFVAPKQGFKRNQGPHYIGTLHVIDIGVPKRLLDELEVR